jgi:hypothetical protein
MPREVVSCPPAGRHGKKAIGSIVIIHKFFHANATIRHRHNTITSLLDDEGNIVNRHDEKEKLLWKAYKSSLRTSEFTHIYFDLHRLLTQSENLEWLDDPFTKDEIDGIHPKLTLRQIPRARWFQWRFPKEVLADNISGLL